MTGTYQTWFKTTLAVEMTPTDVSMIVATAPTITKGRIFLDNGARQEWMSFTGRSGTTLTWLTRWLSTTADPATGWSWYDWMAGTPVKIVAMHDQMPDKQWDESLWGNRSFTWANAWLNLSGAKKAFVTPNLTTIERLALTPASWMLVYDTNLNRLYQYIGWLWSLVDIWTAWWWYTTKTAKTPWTVYQAWTKWWMIVTSTNWWYTTSIVYSDWSNPPTTEIWRAADDWSWRTRSFSCPILPNMYYKVVWWANTYFYE